MRRQCKVEQCLVGDGQRYGSGCGQKPKLKYIFGQRWGATPLSHMQRHTCFVCYTFGIRGLHTLSI